MVDDPREIALNLVDPKSIAEKVPEVEEIVEEARRKAAEATKKFENWEELLNRLRWLAGMSLDIREQDEPSSAAVDEVVGVVEREERPIMAMGVTKALRDQGHRVESEAAIEPILMAAAVAGRIQIGSTPGTYLPLGFEWPGQGLGMQAVPEAHMGLGGPLPSSKAEAALRVLGSEPDRAWSPGEVAEAMAGLGWISSPEKELASVNSTLSRLHGERKIFRPNRGRYQLAPPVPLQVVTE